MDWVGNAKTYRDNGITVFQNVDNSPQVRARALIYADVMQHMLGDKEPRPKTIPSLTAYQCALNAIVLKSYIDHRHALGSMSSKVAEFIAWADKERESPSRELLDKAVECMSSHMKMFVDSYEGNDIGPDEFQELNRTLEIHAFAVMTMSFLEMERLGDDAPLTNLLLEVSPSEWHLEENIVPLLSNIRAVFSIEPGDNEGELTANCTSPSIVGFLLPETKKAFIINNDLEEAKRLLLKGEHQKVMSQGWLNAGIGTAWMSLRDGVYPSLLGEKMTMHVVSNQGILPRHDEGAMEEHIEEFRNELMGTSDADQSASSPESDEATNGVVIQAGMLPESDPERGQIYTMVMNSEGLREPIAIKIRERLDQAFMANRSYDAWKFVKANLQVLPRLLPHLGYQELPNWNTALVDRFNVNDDFWGMLLLQMFNVDTSEALGKKPFVRAMSEGKYNIACALVLPFERKVGAVDELGQEWVDYIGNVPNGSATLAVQLLCFGKYKQDPKKYAAAIKKHPKRFEGFDSYFSNLPLSIEAQGGPMAVAIRHFDS
jgi:hypothetical protein